MRAARAVAAEARRDRERLEEHYGKHTDPGFLLISNAQNLCALLIEHLMALPELSRHAQFFDQLQEEYTPALPPMSSVAP